MGGFHQGVDEVSPLEARAFLYGSGEVAFLDVREAGQFADGHPMFAVPCPYSTFELAVGALVPRLDVPVLLIDAGDGVAQRAGKAMRAMGFSRIALLSGGAPAWERAGYTLYKGVNVPSKTLGELAEHAFHLRTIDAGTLKAWRAERRGFHLFDARPPDEYAKMRIPGAVCLPNGELAHRFGTVPEGIPVIVTCAGRTRSITGALGLAAAGIEGEIYALENGTQGWALAGEVLERGNAVAPFPSLGRKERDLTRLRAEAMLRRTGIPRMTAAEAERLRRDAGRTSYFFDVRSEEEAKGDPLPAFTHALSGQLVQSTDRWIGVWRSRIVIADDLGLRGAIAAYWLRMLGYDCSVVLIDDAVRSLPSRETVLPNPVEVARTDAGKALGATFAGHAQLFDARASKAFQAGHVAGSRWVVRPTLPSLKADPGRSLFVIGESDAAAGLVASDLVDLGHRDVRVVAGGIAALKAAGAAIETSPNWPSRAECIDHVWFADGRHDGDLDASRLYLSWEQGLIAQLDEDERSQFAIPAEAVTRAPD